MISCFAEGLEVCHLVLTVPKLTDMCNRIHKRGELWCVWSVCVWSVCVCARALSETRPERFVIQTRH